MTTRTRLIWTVASATAVAAIGRIDYVTGPDIGLSLFYLLPIALSAWFGGIAAAVIIACAAGASWLAADLAWRESDTAVAISLWNAFTRLVIYNSEGVFIALLRRDREQLKRLALRESALARTDSTTGLPNVRAFLERAAAEIEKARAGSRPLSVLYIDLDDFKLVNDRLGHAAGDTVLERVAGVLKEVSEDAHYPARIGGDEFAMLLCCDVDAEQAQTLAETVAEQVRALTSVYDVAFGATVGVACFREPPANAEELLRAADDAMYRGKTVGKGRVVVQNV